MDLPRITKEIENIPDCQTLQVFMGDIMEQVRQEKEALFEEILEVTAEIAASTTPITYVAYQLKKAKKKLEGLNKYKKTLTSLVELAYAVQAKSNQLGCINNSAETLKGHLESLKDTITEPPII